MLDFLDPSFASNCMWRYYNLTIQSQNPDPHAFIRMALRDEPQGWYNLGLLTAEGYRLPLSVLTQLGLSELYMADNSLLLSTLYERCRDSEDTDSYLPCSLALFKVHLQSFQKDYCTAIMFSTTVAAVAAPTIFLIILGMLRRHVPSPT
ncbi:Protein sel-1 like 3 [Dissostichus eleginoides]|uniref:Protein sel-1 like 3 n=1 Tax=Dissostichus eleginoides TaxID=100907 RepID=A0AAD9CF32_DISEL|nr:Protein sel-1 like 3 [Dissostichus eleginoides]